MLSALDPQPITRDKQMTLALLQELLLALRANDPDDFKACLSLGIEQLARDVAAKSNLTEWCLCWWKQRETG